MLNTYFLRRNNSLRIINWYFCFVSQSNHNRNITHNKLFRITNRPLIRMKSLGFYFFFTEHERIIHHRDRREEREWWLLWIYWWSSWQDGKIKPQYSINDRWREININEFLICFSKVERDKVTREKWEFDWQKIGKWRIKTFQWDDGLNWSATLIFSVSMVRWWSLEMILMFNFTQKPWIF